MLPFPCVKCTVWVVLCWQQMFIRSAATESRDVCSEEPGSACGQGTIRRPCAACKGCSSCLGTGGDLQEVRAAHRLQALGWLEQIIAKTLPKSKKKKIQLFLYISVCCFFSGCSLLLLLCVFIRLVLSWRCYKIKTIFARHCQKHRAAAVSIGCCNKLLVPLISPNQVSCCDAGGFPGNGCSPCFIPLPSPFCRGQIGWIRCSYHRCLKNKASGFFQHERSRISRVRLQNVVFCKLE